MSPEERMAVALESLADSANAAVSSERDLFALATLQGVAGSVIDMSNETIAAMVSNAYRIADAMIKERSK